MLIPFIAVIIISIKSPIPHQLATKVMTPIGWVNVQPISGMSADSPTPRKSGFKIPKFGSKTNVQIVVMIITDSTFGIKKIKRYMPVSSFENRRRVSDTAKRIVSTIIIISLPSIITKSFFIAAKNSESVITCM